MKFQKKAIYLSIYTENVVDKNRIDLDLASIPISTKHS